MTVIGHAGHLVGAQAVSLCEGIEVMAMIVSNDQPAVLFDFDLKPTVQFDRLDNIIQRGIFLTLFQSLQRNDLGFHTGTELGIRAHLQRNGVVVDFIDIVVTGYKLQRASFLKDFHHLAFELAILSHLLHKQFAVAPLL